LVGNDVPQVIKPEGFRSTAEGSFQQMMDYLRSLLRWRRRVSGGDIANVAIALEILSPS